MRPRLLAPCAAALTAGLVAALAAGDDRDRLKVGLQPDGRVVVPTNQVLKPAGRQSAFPGRPVDLAWLDGGKTLAVKNMASVVFLDAATGAVRLTLGLPKGAKCGVVGLLADGEALTVTDAQGKLWAASPNAEGQYRFGEPIPLEKPAVGGDADLAGLARLPGGQLLVCSTRGNTVQLVDPASRKVIQSVAVGVAPYSVAVASADRAYVSNWGGDRPNEGAPQRPTSGTPVEVDPKSGLANRGSVSALVRDSAGKWGAAKSIQVGLHPSGLALSKSAKFLYVANANSDTVSVIDTATDSVVETVACRPEARLPFGSASNAVAVSPDGGTLYVANGANNCVAVVRLAAKSSEGDPVGRPAKSAVAGLIPTGWYPGAVLVSPDGKTLAVANVKGQGSVAPKRPAAKGRNSHDHLGTVSFIDIPDDAKLRELTAEVNANNRLTYSINGLEKPRVGVKPVPVPERHGEPSVFKHVLYVIKENRTYDQVFGDMPEGDGDPKLCMFPELVTPNHHKLAREFVLLDNFYCSGILSADGHSWTDAAYVTDYLEKAFGAFARSYPDDGRDPLAFAPTGFIWDNALSHKLTVRNYGEHVSEEPYSPKGVTWKNYYADHVAGTRKVPVAIKFNTPALAPHSHPTYPYFPLTMPDVYRADLFAEDLAKFEKAGALPNLLIMALPADHCEGMNPDYPTPRAMVADNDLALGRIVEAVSKSKFWADTCILVVEDDPQGGFDHVDGHRTVALAISPYTKRGQVDHTNYNQTGMVKTIELMLGLPPMNQMDLGATPMRGCFQPAPDLTPYKAVPNRIPLDEMNADPKKLSGKARFWAEKSLALNLEQGDRADEDTYNRVLWHATMGFDAPYPAWAVNE